MGSALWISSLLGEIDSFVMKCVVPIYSDFCHVYKYNYMIWLYKSWLELRMADYVAHLKCYGVIKKLLQLS